MQMFDVHQLDGFCLCLECSIQELGAPSVYDALCDWILEVSLPLHVPLLWSYLQHSDPHTPLIFPVANHPRTPPLVCLKCHVITWLLLVVVFSGKHIDFIPDQPPF
jgi:hypothetical protein